MHELLSAALAPVIADLLSTGAPVPEIAASGLPPIDQGANCQRYAYAVLGQSAYSSLLCVRATYGRTNQ